MNSSGMGIAHSRYLLVARLANFPVITNQVSLLLETRYWEDTIGKDRSFGYGLRRGWPTVLPTRGFEEFIMTTKTN